MLKPPLFGESASRIDAAFTETEKFLPHSRSAIANMAGGFAISSMASPSARKRPVHDRWAQNDTPLRGFSFCRLRALGEAIDEIAKPPAVFTVADPNGTWDFSCPVEPSPMGEAHAPEFGGLPTV